MDIRDIANEECSTFTGDSCGFIRKSHPEYRLLIDYYNSIMHVYWMDYFGGAYRLNSWCSGLLVADLKDLTERMCAFLIAPESHVTIGLLNFISGLYVAGAEDKSLILISHKQYPTLFSYWKLLKLLGGKESFLSEEQAVAGMVTPKVIFALETMKIRKGFV